MELLTIQIIGVAISLLSVVVAASATFISPRLNFKNNLSAYKNQVKLDCFRRLFASRYDMNSTEFRFSLNEVYVAFNDNNKIQQKIQNFQRLATARTLANSDLVDLFKLLIQDCGLKKDVDDEFLLSPFLMKT